MNLNMKFVFQIHAILRSLKRIFLTLVNGVSFVTGLRRCEKIDNNDCITKVATNTLKIARFVLNVAIFFLFLSDISSIIVKKMIK